MPRFMPLVGALALAMTTEIAGHIEAKPPGDLVLQARIALVLDARLPASISRPALEEAAAIWAPYGVMISTPDQPPSVDRPTVGRPTVGRPTVDGPTVDCLPGALDEVLTVDIEDTTVAAAWSSPFASIRFLNGVPETTIRLHYGNLTRLGLAAIVLDGAREAQWPRTLRDRVLARMIGRVLAHEVGHWLLRTRSHSATGLMRAVLGVGELGERGRGGFRLDPADLAKLEGKRKKAEVECESLLLPFTF